MLMSKFYNSDVSDKINKIEEEYSILLPSQYKKFLLKYNGGYTPKTKFRIRKISSDIRGFYGVGNVELSFDSIRIQEWINIEVLPIAKDSFGNYIVIGIRENKRGKIYFCNHENGNNIEYLTENFIDFIDLCKSEKISEKAKRSIKEREEELIARGRGHIITDELRKMWQVEIDKYEYIVQEEVNID